MLTEKIAEFVLSHEDYDNKRDEIEILISKKEDKIASLRRQIEKLKEKRKKLSPPMPWTDVLKDIKDDIEKISGLKLEYDGGTFGMRAETYFVLVDPNKNTEAGESNWVYYLVITPHIVWSDNPNRITGLEFYYDTNEIQHAYPKGSIGELNGMNKKTQLLPLDAKEIFEIMKRQSEESA